MSTPLTCRDLEATTCEYSVIVIFPGERHQIRKSSICYQCLKIRAHIRKGIKDGPDEHVTGKPPDILS